MTCFGFDLPASTRMVRSRIARGRVLFPGVLACAVVAAAATFLSQHYHAPVMLFALLLGMAMNFLSGESACAAGIGFAASQILRLGIALLGVRVTLAQIEGIGWLPVLIVTVSVATTIGVSIVAARAFGFNRLFGLLSGGATAICGASAALALAAALPDHPQKERATLFTVIVVSGLSTVAMIAYPMLAQVLNFNATQAGIFLGATIHDVAQVVGAGYSVSHDVGDLATMVKLMRVAMLLPVIALAAVATRRHAGGEAGRLPPLLPWFAVAFAALAALCSLGAIPASVRVPTSELSGWLLVIGIAAIGMKTQLREIATVGLKPVALMCVETIFLAALVIGLLHWCR
jgi:uncharacterized integral membrane protein (TIGR00698 family)